MPVLPVETPNVLFWYLAGPACTGNIANCPLVKISTYENLIYLLNLQMFSMFLYAVQQLVFVQSHLRVNGWRLNAIKVHI